jgi:septum formation protein
MIASHIQHLDIILASQSPRRQELLKGLDIDFTIETRPIEEVYDNQLQAGQITKYLAELKAQAFKGSLLPNQLVITSDTIVWLQDEALEKPKNAQHARQMLAKMSGRIHEVYTSVCFTATTFCETITDVTKVYFKELSPEEINYYVSTYQPFDRAGAYGIQDWIGYTAISKLEGCYYNVMGLPLPKVYDWFKNKYASDEK